MNALLTKINLDRTMTISRKTLTCLALLAAPLPTGAALGQIGLPSTAMTAGRDTTLQATVVEKPLELTANIPARRLVVRRGDSTLKTFAVAVGKDRYPTPTGTFRIKKMIWNPSWRPPPNSEWARGKTAKG